MKRSDTDIPAESPGTRLRAVISSSESRLGRWRLLVEEHGLSREFFEPQVDSSHFGTSAMYGARGNCYCLPRLQSQ
jgi:hypothetical protein